MEDGVPTDAVGLQVDEDGARHVLPCAGLREERVERVLLAAERLVTRHLAVRLDAVLEAVELPAGVADLHARLADVQADHLALRSSIGVRVRVDGGGQLENVRYLVA